ncbi:hypothetical protein Q9189_000963 [Teloschistes chrysophthalmus]
MSANESSTLPDETVVLTLLGPSRRLIGGIPFLYQRISSASPVTALISPKSVVTSLAVVKLDGSTDWMVVGRSLLAWTGQTLSIKPRINSKMSLAHWGASHITGRGLLALAGRGSITQIEVETGESYVAHPRLNDALTSRDVNEIADTPAGLSRSSSKAKASRDAVDQSQELGSPALRTSKQPQMSTASIGSDGKVAFTREDSHIKA